MKKMLTADHEFYRINNGQQGANTRSPCWECEIAKEETLRGTAPWRTTASIAASADLFPKKVSKGCLLYIRNEFKSVEFPQILEFDPETECSYGPLHCVFGECQRVAFDPLLVALANLDGTSVTGLEDARLLAAAKERAAELAACRLFVHHVSKKDGAACADAASKMKLFVKAQNTATKARTSAEKKTLVYQRDDETGQSRQGAPGDHSEIRTRARGAAASARHAVRRRRPGLEGSRGTRALRR